MIAVRFAHSNDLSPTSYFSILFKCSNYDHFIPFSSVCVHYFLPCSCLLQPFTIAKENCDNGLLTYTFYLYPVRHRPESMPREGSGTHFGYDMHLSSPCPYANNRNLGFFASIISAVSFRFSISIFLPLISLSDRLLARSHLLWMLCHRYGQKVSLT